MAEEVDIDLSNYKDRVGARILPGRYLVVVEDTELDTSSAGNKMINLWLRVVGGEFDGSTIVDRLTMTDKALFRVVGFMQAIGLPTPKKRLRVNIRQFLGKRLEIDVEDGEPYNGRVKSEVRGYLRATKQSGQGQQEAAAASVTEAGDLDDLEGLDEFRGVPPQNGGEDIQDEASTGAAVTPPEQAADKATPTPEQTAEDEPAPEEIDLDKLEL